MGKGTAPTIEVGIVSSGRIRFSLEGGYTLPGRDEVLSGNVEACLKRGSIEIIQNGKTYTAGDSVILKPADSSKDRFIIREVCQRQSENKSFSDPFRPKGRAAVWARTA